MLFKKIFLILGFGRLLTTEYHIFGRVSDTRPNRVSKPSIGSALPLKYFAGTSRTSTSAPSIPHLEPKPSPISNQPLIETINSSLLPNRNATLHSFISACSPPSQSSHQSLYRVSEAEVSPLLNSLPNKQWELDPRLSSKRLCKSASVILHVITKINNLSLSTGNFPMAFKNTQKEKHSLVTRLLKKANHDKENLFNYPPIRNLSFLSKLTLRIVLARLK